ncbi:MAG: TlyA family RNA methyltransferase [Acidobacteriota bacterium]
MRRRGDGTRASSQRAFRNGTEDERIVAATSARARLDDLVVARGLAATRARARAMIMAGDVSVDGQPAAKPGQLCRPDCDVALRTPDHPYVGRGGLKLAGALDRFGTEVAGLVCGDIGASTGGFVDCLLKRGASRVFAVDTGNVLDDRVRNDPRVVYLKNTNARYLKPEHVGCPLDLITVDVSFISVRKIIPALMGLLARDGKMLVLVKPQFEMDRAWRVRGSRDRKGIVREPETHRRVLTEIFRFMEESGLRIEGLCDSPILGARGNREFFLLASRSGTATPLANLSDLIDRLLRSPDPTAMQEGRQYRR